VGRAPAPPGLRHQEKDDQGDDREQRLGRHDPGPKLGKSQDHPDGSTHRSALAGQGPQLHQDQQNPDTRHEARNDAVGHQGDVAPEAKAPQQHLGDSRHQHHGEGHGQTVLRMCRDQLGDHRSHDHRHRPGRLRNQRPGSSEKGREEPDHDRPIETGLGTRPGRDPKSQGQGQRNDRRSQPAEKIPLPADVVEPAFPREQTGPFSPIDHLPLYRRLPRKRQNPSPSAVAPMLTAGIAGRSF